MDTYTGYRFKAGDKVECIQECSGQGGTVKEGEKGIIDESFYDGICPACVDFKREDGTFAHVASECFKLLNETH